MKIFPAIDLYNGKAVRLLKGDYNNMTVYSNNPIEIAMDFKNQGAEFIHIVDLEGARNGTTPNIEIVKDICNKTELFCEVGGGIRSLKTVETYLSSGINRVILGTAAVKDEAFLKLCLDKYKFKIAVGADIKNGFISVNGWTENSNCTTDEFFKKMVSFGVTNIICTDISKDGAMKGTNLNLYKEISNKYDVDITASGGVSSINDIVNLNTLNIYAAIIGKAYYTGKITIKDALEAAK